MKSVGLYARVSSDHQAEQETVASQVAGLRSRIERDGDRLNPNDVYVDEGYSGASLIRPALERLRDRAAQGGLDRLYVHSPDRLARRYAYQVLLLEELKRHRVEVVFLNGSMGDTPDQALLVQVQGMIAEYERALIAERCRRGKLHRGQSGSVNVLSGAPYGYLYVRKDEGEPARYQMLLHEARTVRNIFRWLVEEQQSVRAIARRLSREGVVTRRGRTRWDSSTVWGILRNPAYAGRAAFGKTEAVERHTLLRPLRGGPEVPRRPKSSYRDRPREQWVSIPVPPIVSEAVFQSAQEQLERNRRLARRNAAARHYLLQGLVVCAQCGYACYGTTSRRRGGAPYGYYRCAGRDKGRYTEGTLCGVAPVRTDALEQHVWDSVRQVLNDPDRLMGEWSRRGSEAGAKAQLRTEREEARRYLTAQVQALVRLQDAYEAGALTVPELTERSQRVRQRQRQAQLDLEEAEKRLTESVEIESIVGRLADFAEGVKDRLDQADWPLRQHLIRALVSRIELTEDGATVVYRIPASSKSPVPPSGPTGGEGAPSIHRLRGRSSSSARPIHL